MLEVFKGSVLVMSIFKPPLFACLWLYSMMGENPGARDLRSNYLARKREKRLLSTESF